MGVLLAERKRAGDSPGTVRPDRTDSNGPVAELHPGLFDLASGLEHSRYPLVILSARQDAAYANAAAAQRIGLPGGWSTKPFSTEPRAGEAADSMAVLETWIRRMGNRVKRKGPWPREIIIKSGLCKGKWLASQLTNASPSPVGTLITGTTEPDSPRRS